MTVIHDHIFSQYEKVFPQWNKHLHPSTPSSTDSNESIMTTVSNKTMQKDEIDQMTMENKLGVEEVLRNVKGMNEENLKIRFKDVSVLMNMDWDKDGLFSLVDMLVFGEWICNMVEEKVLKKGDQCFQNEMAFHCRLGSLLYCIKEEIRENGDEVKRECLGRHATKWTLKLLNIVKADGVELIGKESLEVLHLICDVKRIVNIGLDEFLEILEKVAENLREIEKSSSGDLCNLDNNEEIVGDVNKINVVENEKKKGLVPKRIVEIFLDNFFNAMFDSAIEMFEMELRAMNINLL